MNRHLNFQIHKMGLIIILEGPISVGKTTLGNSLERRGTFLGCPVVFLSEQTNPAHLNLYLSDQKKYAYSYQSVALMRRFNTHAEATRLANQGYCVIIDRGIAGDLAFALMQKDRDYFTNEEWEAYWSLVNEHRESSWKPDLVIHLACPPEKAFTRLKRRGNPSEIKSYTLEYFEQLEASHLKAFHMYTEFVDPSAFITIDWSSSVPPTSVNLRDSLTESGEVLPDDYLQKFEDLVSQKLNRPQVSRS